MLPNNAADEVDGEKDKQEPTGLMTTKRRTPCQNYQKKNGFLSTVMQKHYVQYCYHPPYAFSEGYQGKKEGEEVH